MQRFDVVIVGAGPAGLSAALVLGRCGRKLLLCDRGTPRSWASKAIHGFITRDGCPPHEFAHLAHAELARYPCITVDSAEVQQAAPARAELVVVVGKRTVRARKLLIATGQDDQLTYIVVL